MEDDVMDKQEQQQANTGTRPVAKFSGSGGLNLAIWKSKSEQGYDNYSVRIERTYKDGDDFKTTSYLRPEDLLRTSQLLTDADRWIEQDKGRQRFQGSGKEI